MAKTLRVPIVTYHSVADEHDHLVSNLSLPVALFERQLQHLHAKRFQTVSLYDIHDHLRTGTPLPDRSIALTFDDGYLDNWVHVFPLLKKYGFKATIFVATDFVDPYPRCRPTLEDVWAGRITSDRLDWWGYVSWEELRAMQASGLVDVQAHTRTHAWYFTSDRIVDFHHPADTYFWLDWHYRPGEKHSWLTRDFRTTVPWGTPVYEFSSTLLKRRYFDDANVARCATEYVRTCGGVPFFDRQDWRQDLTRVVAAFRHRNAERGRLESDAEYVARVIDEMAGSKRIIAAQLGTPVDFLCWPCGDYTPRLQRLAIEECGFRATVNVDKRTNCRGDDPTELRRIVFGQDYAGLWRQPLIFMNFRGNVSYYSGHLLGYPAAPIARRLMRVGRLVDHVSRIASANVARRE
jgi:hypothetical protein